VIDNTAASEGCWRGICEEATAAPRASAGKIDRFSLASHFDYSLA
jgi:hypothetical protein